MADADALPIAYRSGIVASGRQLAKTAMIDMRGWDDSNFAENLPPGYTPNQIPIHHQWFSVGIRDRISAEADNANNQALWRFARTGLTPPGGTDVCDWTKPGVGQQAAVSPLTFAAGPGGVSLPPAPVSVPK